MSKFESPETNPAEIEKEQKWTELRDNVDSIVDKLGEGVDEGIKGSVIALSANEFPTSSSCEGHLSEMGASYPWVEIYTPEPEGWKNDTEKQKEWTEENLKQQMRMIDMFNEFYQNRETPIDARLNFRYIGAFGGFRIQSMGSEVMQLLSTEEKEQKLKEYRKEMDDFSEFLKKRFFNK